MTTVKLKPLTTGFAAYLVAYDITTRTWITQAKISATHHEAGSVSTRDHEAVVYAKSPAKAATTANDLMRKGAKAFAHRPEAPVLGSTQMLEPKRYDRLLGHEHRPGEGQRVTVISKHLAPKKKAARKTAAGKHVRRVDVEKLAQEFKAKRQEENVQPAVDRVKDLRRESQTPQRKKWLRERYMEAKVTVPSDLQD